MGFRDHFSLQRLQALESRYRSIRRRLANELKRPAPDMLTIQSLKRQRLRLKDQITELVKPSSPKTPIHN